MPEPIEGLGESEAGVVTQLWIVGKSLGSESHWEFQGVFDGEDKALAACHGPLYFVAPAALNVALSDETLPAWEGLYWPAERAMVG